MTNERYQNLSESREEFAAMCAVLDALTAEEKGRRAASIRAMPYPTFLQTDYWRIIRAYVLSMRAYKCFRCGSQIRIELHHTSYVHHGTEHEHLEDLELACGACHRFVHAVDLMAKGKLLKHPEEQEADKKVRYRARMQEVWRSERFTNADY